MATKLSFEGWPIANSAPLWVRIALVFKAALTIEEGGATVRYKELRGAKYITSVKWAPWV
jgi:hypothetical protein